MEKEESEGRLNMVSMFIRPMLQFQGPPSATHFVVDGYISWMIATSFFVFKAPTGILDSLSASDLRANEPEPGDGKRRE